MMKKRTRRILALVALVIIFSGLEPLIKLLIALPIIQILFIEYDEFNLSLKKGEDIHGI